MFVVYMLSVNSPHKELGLLADWKQASNHFKYSFVLFALFTFLLVVRILAQLINLFCLTCQVDIHKWIHHWNVVEDQVHKFKLIIPFYTIELSNHIFN